MRKIYLYGDLGKKYGKEHSFDVCSVNQAMRALKCAYPSFYDDIDKDGLYTVYHGNEIKKDNALSYSEISMISDTGDYHIVPMASGSKSQRSMGITFAVIGIALIATGNIPAVAAFSSGLASFSVSMGVGLALSGIATMLSPALETKKDVADKKSFVFNGADNVSVQGGPVPLIYGKHEVGSVIISTSLEAINV